MWSESEMREARDVRVKHAFVVTAIPRSEGERMALRRLSDVRRSTGSRQPQLPRRLLYLRGSQGCNDPPARIRFTVVAYREIAIVMALRRFRARFRAALIFA